jgi:penicillin amidase
VGDELGEAFAGRYEERPEVGRFLADTLADPASPWCDDTATQQTEGCAEAAERALNDALRGLSARMGGEMESWRWDRLHRAVFAHQPFNNVKTLRPFFSRSVGNGGDRSTVNVGPFVSGGSFEQYVAPGFRQLIDLSDLDGGRFTLAPGQSGHFLSSHYADLLEDWRVLRYRPLRFERATIERGPVERLRLEP